MSIKKRILITGASGMLGATLVKSFSDFFSVFATGNTYFEDSLINYKKFDLRDDNYHELIAWSKPDIIIHSGAITNFNYCNDNPIDAFNVNGFSLKKLMDATKDNVKIIYISTDAVFPSKLNMAQESDCVFSENIYGKSKELGEFFLLTSDRVYKIIRTTIVGLNINKSKSSFVEWMVNASLNDEEISLFNDVIFTPISIWALAEEIKFLINYGLESSEILHIAGNEQCSKYEFGKSLLEELSIPTKLVKKGSINMFKDRAKRCSDQTLNCETYQNKYHRKLPSLKETVTSIKRNYNE